MLRFSYRFECKHFGLQEPGFPVADELKTDIAEYESNWVLFEQFNNGLGELTKEDWISFRSVGFATTVLRSKNLNCQADFVLFEGFIMRNGMIPCSGGYPPLHQKKANSHNIVPTQLVF